MNFVTDIPKEKYDEFVKKNEIKSHFLQSYAWGVFSKKSRGLIPYYVGMVNDKDELVASALLLKKTLPLGFSYFYSPRGYVIDFFNHQLVSDFTKEIVKFIKKQKGIFLKIDPDLIWREENSKGEELSTKYDSKYVFDNLKKIGFKHLGFTKNFETMQPRYSFRIDMNNSLETIENNFSKTTKQRIKKANSLNTKVRIGTARDIEVFNDLMTITENRKDFISHDLDYYKNLYEIYNEDNKFNLFIGSIDLDEIIQKYEQELENCEKELEGLPKENLSKSQNNKKKELVREIEGHQKALEQYKKDKAEYGSKVILNAHGIIEYGNKAWVLYAGNHNILTSTYSNYKTYHEHIKYCHENGIKMYDQFGTIGDLSKDNPRLGLHEFKKKFGGNYVEFIGEFDYITNHLMYFCFTKLVPLYRNLVKKKAKMNRKRGM